MAGGGRRPARHGLLRAPGARPHPRAADRRPRGAWSTRSASTGPVVTVGARLGRRDLARLGAGPPRPRARRRARQHRRPPARRRGRAVAHPAGPHPGAAARGLHRHAHVRPRRRPRCPGPACPPTCATRSPRRTRTAARRQRRRRVRGRHPARSRARQRADAGRDRRGSPGAGRRARADAVGAPRPRLLRPLPARPARAAAARARPPLRAGLAPRHRRRSRQRGRRLALAAEPRPSGPPPRARAACRPAAGLGRVGGARGRPGRRRASSSRAAAAPISFDLLERRVRELAAGLAATGVRAGERVALLVPPGADLTAAAYACWRAGAVVVLADAGLGPVGLARALRGAAPDHVIGVARGLALARLLGIPGRRILAGPREPGAAPPARLPTRAGRHRPHRPRDRPAATRRPGRRGRGAVHLRRDRAREGRGLPAPPAAGPARHPAHRLRDHRRRPARGGVPAVRALRARAGHRLRHPRPPASPQRPHRGRARRPPPTPWTATVVFASPAALRGVVATVDGLGPTHRAALARIRLVVSAGRSGARGAAARRCATSSPAPTSTPRTA